MAPLKAVPSDEVLSMSNAELADRLRGFGVQVGPVVGTTRRVYEKKLAQLLATGGEVQTEYSDHQSTEESAEEEEVVIVAKPKTKRGEKTVRQRTAVAKEEPVVVLEETHVPSAHGTPGLARQPIRKTKATKQTAAPQKNQAESHSLVPGWLKFLLLVLFCVLVYWVIATMDVASMKPKALDFF